MKKILFCCGARGCRDASPACGGKRGRGSAWAACPEFDSLSYSLGANIGYGMNHEMRDIPFDFKAIDKGIKEGAHGQGHAGARQVARHAA